MFMYLDKSKDRSPYNVTFYQDGSFGLADGNISINYEIDYSEDGSIGTMCRLISPKAGQCMWLMGYSWKLFDRLKKGEIDVSASKAAALCFHLEGDDPTEWGTNSHSNLSATLFDQERGLVLFGEKPEMAAVYEFAVGQYAVMLGDKVCGFVLRCPMLGKNERSQ